MFAWNINDKIWSFEFYPAKAAYFECNGFHGPPLLTFKTDRYHIRGLDLEKMTSLLTSLLYMQNTGSKVWKPESPLLHVNSAAYTRIAFLNCWVFYVIFSSTQLSQDFKLSNGGPISKKIPVKINRCLFKIRT